MNDTATISVDSDLMKKASELCEQMGIPIDVAVVMFFKAIIRIESILFKVLASDPFYSETNLNHLRKSIKELEQSSPV